MKRKDWPNLWRMFAALLLLLLSPLLGILVGALVWGSLERGLMVFNLLGLVGFTLTTRPYWRGNGKRVRALLVTFCSMGVSALLDIISGRPVPFAVYFASMVECFSLIPWITEILKEIHQGQWRREPPAPVQRAASGRRTTPDPWRPAARRNSRPEPEGPELPVPGVPRWVFLLIALFLILAVGLLLW